MQRLEVRLCTFATSLEAMERGRSAASHYETAKKMLGVARNPNCLKPTSPQANAEKRGWHTFRATDVALFREEGVTVADPFFSGEGPERAGCRTGRSMGGVVTTQKYTSKKNFISRETV